MAEQHRPDDLAQLRATVTTLQARLARVERRKRLPRRVVPLALVALLVALMPLSILAAGPVFSDLGTAAPVHQANIQAIGDAGITTGFEDPANPGQRTYNPKGLVTREEMASFLARTAGLGANPAVANAKTAQTVPDGSVTAAKLSNSGATTGQVLTATGTGVAWQAVPSPVATTATVGLYSGAVNADGTPQGTAFSTTRTGPGSYTITFPAGSFPASTVGRFIYIVAMPVSTVTVLGNQGHLVLADGSSFVTITFTGDTLFNFIVAPGR